MTAVAKKSLEHPLVCEWFDVTPKFEAADKADETRLARLTYEFKTADCVNGNGRVYPAEVILPAIQVLNEKCKKGQVYGRNDHPDPWDPNARIPTIKDAATRVMSAEMVGDKNVSVVHDVLRNPFGAQLMSTIAAGGKPGISQRGMAVFEEASREEKAVYGANEDAPLEICRFLRLVTFDVVSQPGFADANDPTIESKSEKDLIMWKTAQEVKTNAPAIANELIAEGKASVDVAQIASEAVEKEKPVIIEAATKPLKDELAAAQEKITKLSAFAESCKSQLLAAGIAVEQVSDAEMKRRADEAATKAADAEAKLKTANESLAEANRKLADAETKQKKSAALAAVQEKHGKSKHWAQIQEAVKEIADEKLALEAAAMKVAEINAIIEAAGVKPGATETTTHESDEPSGGANRVKEGAALIFG